MAVPPGELVGSDVEFAIFNNRCPCLVMVSDMAKENTLYLPSKSIAGTKSKFEGQGQDRK